jgi:hypothetical protein
MSATARLLVAVLCLALGVVGQLALVDHLQRGTGPGVSLTHPLADFPSELDAPGVKLRWLGETDAQEARYRQQAEFANELIFRSYLATGPGPAAKLYLVYSQQADDRKHHPETCLGDWQGLAEDSGLRGVLYLDGETSRPVQRFRFRAGVEQYTTIYYWHYTLEPAFQPGQSVLQALHWRWGHLCPSLTVQVFTSVAPEELAPLETSFLPAVDGALRQGHLPPTSCMGCDRLNMSLSDRASPL